MLFMPETHQVVRANEDEFEPAYRDAWMAQLAKGDDARLPGISTTRTAAVPRTRW